MVAFTHSIDVLLHPCSLGWVVTQCDGLEQQLAFLQLALLWEGLSLDLEGLRLDGSRWRLVQDVDFGLGWDRRHFGF